MDAIRRKSGNLKPMPCEYFDLVGGTSTGGLIAIMLGRLGMVALYTANIADHQSLLKNALRLTPV